MLFVYFKTLLGVLVNYVLGSIQDLPPSPVAAYFNCSIIYLPSGHGELWVFVDGKKKYGLVVLDGASEFLVGWGCVA